VPPFVILLPRFPQVPAQPNTGPQTPFTRFRHQKLEDFKEIAKVEIGATAVQSPPIPEPPTEFAVFLNIHSSVILLYLSPIHPRKERPDPDNTPSTTTTNRTQTRFDNIRAPSELVNTFSYTGTFACAVHCSRKASLTDSIQHRHPSQWVTKTPSTWPSSPSRLSVTRVRSAS